MATANTSIPSARRPPASRPRPSVVARPGRVVGGCGPVAGRVGEGQAAAETGGGEQVRRNEMPGHEQHRPGEQRQWPQHPRHARRCPEQRRREEQQHRERARQGTAAGTGEAGEVRRSGAGGGAPERRGERHLTGQQQRRPAQQPGPASRNADTPPGCAVARARRGRPRRRRVRPLPPYRHRGGQERRHQQGAQAPGKHTAAPHQVLGAEQGVPDRVPGHAQRQPGHRPGHGRGGGGEPDQAGEQPGAGQPELGRTTGLRGERQPRRRQHNGGDESDRGGAGAAYERRRGEREQEPAERERAEQLGRCLGGPPEEGDDRREPDPQHVQQDRDTEREREGGEVTVPHGRLFS
ncbi:hypothetical protein [Micromonospora chalcea]|uniref:hypothetical protein n=1 Tax=Micromonospora chalcea TaxID=1874 RepID=UPI001F2BD367|nr:hypothetical protein [Micromonospora chalcea]